MDLFSGLKEGCPIWIFFQLISVTDSYQLVMADTDLKNDFLNVVIYVVRCSEKDG